MRGPSGSGARPTAAGCGAPARLVVGVVPPQDVHHEPTHRKPPVPSGRGRCAAGRRSSADAPSGSARNPRPPTRFHGDGDRGSAHRSAEIYVVDTGSRTFTATPGRGVPSTATQIPYTRVHDVQPLALPRLLLICTRERAWSSADTRCRYIFPATRARTMSPTAILAGSTGATVTSWRLRISGTMEAPRGRNSTVAPCATFAAMLSIIPIAEQDD